MISKGKLDRIRALDVSHTANLNEASLLKFIRQRGRLIEGLAVAGKPRLAEQFFVNVIPLMKRIRYTRIIIVKKLSIRYSVKIRPIKQQISFCYGHKVLCLFCTATFRSELIAKRHSLSCHYIVTTRRTHCYNHLQLHRADVVLSLTHQQIACIESGFRQRYRQQKTIVSTGNDDDITYSEHVVTMQSSVYNLQSCVVKTSCNKIETKTSSLETKTNTKNSKNET